LKHFRVMMGYFTLVWVFIFLFILMGNNDILGKVGSNNDKNDYFGDYSKSISNKLVRFHVIANSDSSDDQRVKLLIRDAILKDVGEPLTKFNSSKESLVFLGKKTKEIERIANEILQQNGKIYKSKAMIGEFNFPIKTYGSITLPPGQYNALRIVLGKGDGKNWWCVMFPPLCFIDITRGLTSEETDKSLGKILNNKEIKKITSTDNIKTTMKEKSKNTKPNIEFKFKSIELIKKIMHKI
jgi:stage II sporulation protein R